MKNADTIDSIYIMSILSDIEKKIDVKSWKVNGINVWPMLRLSIRPLLFDKLNLKHQKKNHQQFSISKFLKVKLLFMEIKKFPFIYFLKQRDVLYMSDGASLDSFNGVWSDKFFRPMLKELDNLNLSYAFASPFEINKVSLNVQNFSLSWLSTFAEIIASVRIRFICKKFDLNGYDEFIELLKKYKIPLKNFEKKEIFYRSYVISVLSRIFLLILKRIKPSVCFIVSYYHDIGFALNRACKNLEIPSVEIQHGTQGNIHDAYNQWFNIPEDGYAELPQIFWVWSDNDASSINCWAKNTNGEHAAFVTGHLSHKFWMNEVELTKAYDEKIEDLKKIMNPREGALDILVALQPVKAFEKYWNVLASVIQDRSLNVRWWLRHHPLTLSSSKFDGLSKILTITKKNINFEDATILPLCSLLKNIDLHITVRSSTAIEAESFGVPTLFLSSFGYGDHQNTLNPFSMCVIEKGIDITHFINTFDKKNTKKMKTKNSTEQFNLKESLRGYILKC